MAYSRRGALAALATATASLSAFSGTLSRPNPRTFERLAIDVTVPDSLWVGTLGFQTVDNDERWEDLYGFGAHNYVAPNDFKVHVEVRELYAPVEFVAAPMAGFDPANPMTATLSADGKSLASGVVESADDAITIRLE